MEFPGIHRISEPRLMFDAFGQNPYHIHPLKGLIEFGPYSYRLAPIGRIRVGVICPKNCFHIIQNLFNELNKTHNPLERVNYLPSFAGFENVFKVKLELLEEKYSIQIDGARFLSSSNKPYIVASHELGNAINSMSQKKQDFDVLYIYLPEQWQAIFEDQETGFDLHDFLKAKTALHSIPTQIIREGSAIKYRCRCSVMWRLGIALYVKGGGVPWKLSTMDQETAFIGLSCKLPQIRR